MPHTSAKTTSLNLVQKPESGTPSPHAKRVLHGSNLHYFSTHVGGMAMGRNIATQLYTE